MRFSLPFVAAAALFSLATAKPTLESRQIEALKFGVLTIAPYNQTLKLGQVSCGNLSNILVSEGSNNSLLLAFHCELQLDTSFLATLDFGCLHPRYIPQQLCHAILPAASYGLSRGRSLLLVQYYRKS